MGPKDMVEEEIKPDHLEARQIIYSLMGKSSLGRSKSLKKNYDRGKKILKNTLDSEDDEEDLKKNFAQGISDVTVKKSLEEDFVVFNSTVEGVKKYLYKLLLLFITNYCLYLKKLTNNADFLSLSCRLLICFRFFFQISFFFQEKTK